MDLVTLIVYGAINGTMVVLSLLRRNAVYEFPFWAGALSLGWFFPMAVGGYLTGKIPGEAYANGMIFASICTGALWFGFVRGRDGEVSQNSWLAQRFDYSKLIKVGVVLSVLGFYFLWKLSNLPEVLC